MRIPRIYTDQPLKVDTLGRLGDQAAHYVATVLRIQPGRELILFNGEGGEYRARVTSVSKRQVDFEVLAFYDEDRQSPLQCELAIGLSKGDRMDWVIQKATELGVTSIAPLFTDRTEVKLSGQRLEKKQHHWQQVMISACEQSHRNRLVTIQPPVSFSDYLNQCDATCGLLLQPTEDHFDINQQDRPSNVSLLVGPEGGFSDAEVANARAHQFHGWTLGPRILRTETAPVAAIALLQSLWGDWR